MKIDLLDIERLISVNKLQEVTSPQIFSGKMFHPQGIFSNDIFGISKGDRRSIFAYIDLRRYFLHPHVYNMMKKQKMFQNIDLIISGQSRYSISPDGILIQDDDGWTGIRNLYNHWDEIKWDKSKSANTTAKGVLSKLGKTQAFITKILICPPAYRDIMISGTVDASDYISSINKSYVKVIRSVIGLSEGGMFADTNYNTQLSVQSTLLEIYDFFKDQIPRKRGLIRRYLIGKSVDFGTRSVISAFPYNNETIQENMVDIDHTALPISQCCSTFYPFIESWLKNFFTREIINDPNLVSYFDTDKSKEVQATLKEPDVQFSDKSIRKYIDDYVFNPDNRFKIITVDAIVRGPKKDSEIKAYLILKGKVILQNNVEKTLNRPLTITDILYLACVDVCEKRHVMITRYPVGTDKGLFMNKVRVQSTREHQRVIFNGKEYPYYPYIDFKTPHDKIGVKFVDTVVFSHSYLQGLGGDYDGDTVSVRGLWTDEANLEAEEIMNRKMAALDITGGNSRVVSKEIFNSYYALTKIESDGKKISDSDTKEYLDMKPDDFTRSKLVSMFAITTDISNEINTDRRKARHNTWDSFTIPPNYFYPGQAGVETTIGRFLFNKYVLEGSNIIAQTGIILDIMNKSGIGKIDSLIAELYLDDKITRGEFNTYTDRRDNLGYWLNGMLAHTISAKMLKPLKLVEKRKAELIKANQEGIDNKDLSVMLDISSDLVDYAKDLLKGDPGMDLYDSGDLDFSNNYKNNSILKGPVANNLTQEFDFIDTSFMDGIEVKDLPAHANSILAGQYPASIATKDSGYMGKKLLALMQMMQIDEPGTDCGTKNLIPITITKNNQNEVVHSYFEEGNQLHLLTKENVGSYFGKTLRMRSPMSCTTKKICSKCAGELFYKLGVTEAGLFSTQISHTLLNLALKSKHVSAVNLYHFNVDDIIQNID